MKRGPARALVLAGMMSLGAVSLGAPDAGALCINNNSNVPITFWVIGMRDVEDFKPRFRVRLNPAQQGCCDWRNPSCNVGGRQDNKFNINIDPLESGNLCHLKVTADADVTLRTFYMTMQSTQCEWRVR